MTKKLPYTHEVCSGQVRFLDSSDILFYFSLVLFTLTLSHIIATRVGLDLSYDPYFKKFIDLCDQMTYVHLKLTEL